MATTKIKTASGTAEIKAPTGVLSKEIASRKNAESYYSILDQLPNPDEVLRKQGKTIEIYRQLRSDSKVQAVLGSRRAGVKKYLCEIDENEADSRLVDLVNTLLSEDWSLHKLIDEIIEAAEFGYKPFELLFENKYGCIVPTAFPNDDDGKPNRSESSGLVGKPPEWFAYSNDNKLLFQTYENYVGEKVPDKKFVVARRSASYANPYGEAILSAVFWPVMFKKNSLKFWNVFIEKFGMPFIAGKYGRGTNKTEQSKLLDMLVDMVQDSAAVMPEGNSIELIERKGGAGSDNVYKNFINEMDKAIAQAILGQNLTSDVSAGSLAAATVHEDVKEEIVNDDAKIVESFFNDVFEIIRDINFPDSRVPQMTLTSPKAVDKTLAERDKTLTETGVKFNKVYYINNHGLKEEEFEVSSETTTTPSESTFSEAEERKAREEALFPGQTAIDEFIDNIPAKEYAEISNEMISPILKIVEESNDFSEAMDQLIQAFPEMKTDKLEDSLKRAIFVSETLGNIEPS